MPLTKERALGAIKQISDAGVRHLERKVRWQKVWNGSINQLPEVGYLRIEFVRSDGSCYASYDLDPAKVEVNFSGDRYLPYQEAHTKYHEAKRQQDEEVLARNELIRLGLPPIEVCLLPPAPPDDPEEMIQPVWGASVSYFCDVCKKSAARRDAHVASRAHLAAVAAAEKSKVGQEEKKGEPSAVAPPEPSPVPTEDTRAEDAENPPPVGIWGKKHGRRIRCTICLVDVQDIPGTKARHVKSMLHITSMKK